MAHRPSHEPDPDRLAEPVASQLLTRASELDAAMRSGATIAELRAAAMEAGISPEAFDAALAELAREQAPAPDAPRPRRRRWTWGLTAAVAGAGLVAFFAIARMFPRADVAAATTVEEMFQLRCLTRDRAAALVRPLLGPATTMMISPTDAPAVIIYRGPPHETQRIRAELAKYEGTGSGACPVAPTPAPPPR